MEVSGSTLRVPLDGKLQYVIYLSKVCAELREAKDLLLLLGPLHKAW